MNKAKLLYEGKAKSVFETDEPDVLVMEFRDDTSAFDGKKVEQLSEKGAVNNHFNAFIMQQLEAAGIETQLIASIDDTHCKVKRLEMVAVECVVRNVAAGSLCRRLGIEEGTALTPPVFELFLKNDPLGDPFINTSHCVSFGWATEAQIETMEVLSLRVNDVLKGLFQKAGLQLVDFKLEFGMYQGRLVLGDEFSPDGCRLWDIETNEKKDKDRFRQSLGGVIDAYKEVAQRIGVPEYQ